MKKFWKKTEGFTLVELIVVIAILGILAGVGTVGYSGYIKKANMAADQQLLRDLNTAFAVACIENGVDNTQVTAENINVPSGGKVDGTILEVTATATVPAAKAGDIETAFGNYFEGGTFKVMDKLIYSNGAFAPNGAVPVKYGNQEITFTAEQIAAIKNSNFGKLGAIELVSKVNMATEILKSMSAGGIDKVNALIGSSNNYSTLATILGCTSDEEFDVVMEDLIDKTVAATGMDRDAAEMSILSNNAVLTAATNSSLFDRNAFVNQLADGTAYNAIMGNLTSTDEENMGVALSQAAMAYGMYTSYAAKNGISSEGMNMWTVINALDDEGFQQYMSENAEADVNAYYAAMDMINTSSQNKVAVEDILINGFDTQSLKDMVADALD